MMMAPICRPICRPIIEPVARADGGVRVMGGSAPTPDPTLAVLKAAAVSLWTFNDLTTGLQDVIGPNHLTLVGSPTSVSGILGFNAIQSEVATMGVLYCASSVGILRPGSWYWSVWVKGADYRSTTIMGTGVNGSGNRMKIDRHSASQVRVNIIDALSNGTTVYFANSMLANQWNHVIVYYDHVRGVIGSITNNGTPAEAPATGVAITTTVSEFGFFYTPGTSSPLRITSLDQPGFYAGVPTPEMIAALWNGGAGISNSTIVAA